MRKRENHAICEQFLGGKGSLRGKGVRTCRKTYLGYGLSLKEKEREEKGTVIISWARKKKSSRINIAAWAVTPEETAEFLGRESTLSQ